jgi:hypothetical protein
MTSQMSVDFGYCPETLALNSPLISIRALPNLRPIVDEVPSSSQIAADWIVLQRDFAGVVNLLLSEIAKRRPKAGAN